MTPAPRLPLLPIEGGLPIEAVLPDLLQALRRETAAVLQAPPGAGKTTRVPLALLDEGWLGRGRVLMLEPRRLAARAAATRMAWMRGESVGDTVGYRTRLDSAVGRHTRIEVVTEGILTRRLQTDPDLDGVGVVLFDEFHERSLHADLGLALCLDARAVLRPDLRLVVMSATLDGEPIARLLGGCPVVTSAGRAWPVETRYLDRPPTVRVEAAVAAAVDRALDNEADGDVLVFLPGTGEIRRTAALLAESGLPTGVRVRPLYGDLPPAAQDDAIRPAPPGERKVVLATSIAETSLTIDGVRVVVDCGLMRVPRFDPRSGMTRLETVRVSRASADQRRGRAGRLGPGVCYRLWNEAAHTGLKAFSTPEILEADLAPLALELALWGVADPGTLSWLDPPPAAALAQARDLLADLGALEADVPDSDPPPTPRPGARLSAHGRDMARLGLHPRLAHMLVRARERGHAALGCDVAALLAERDILRAAPGFRDADIGLRVDLIAGDEGRSGRGETALPAGLGLDRNALRQARRVASDLRRRLGVGRADPSRDPDGGIDRRGVGTLVALAYPDRVAQRRGGGEPGAFRLTGGGGASLPATDPLAAADWLAVADLDGDRRDARIYLAAPLTGSEVETLFADRLQSAVFVRWDSRDEAVQARRQLRLKALVLEDRPLADPDPALVTTALIDGIRQLGLAVALPWTPEVERLRARVAFLRAHSGGSDDGADGDDLWPDWSDAALGAGLEDWLAPHLAGRSRRSHLKGLDLADILLGQLSWDRRPALDRLAPTHLTVPSGSRLPLTYGSEGPVLAVRLQEMFGCAETPTVATGRVPVTLHLLSPAGRPVQVTRDLAGFWAGSYRQVRADLRGRYPKHPWPDDPMAEPPTRRTKPR